MQLSVIRTFHATSNFSITLFVTKKCIVPVSSIYQDWLMSEVRNPGIQNSRHNFGAIRTFQEQRPFSGLFSPKNLLLDHQLIQKKGRGYCPEGFWTITSYCPEPLSNVRKCWLAMLLGVGILCWVLACCIIGVAQFATKLDMLWC